MHERKINDKFMLAALELAGTALSLGEVPVGAVIVKDGGIIARAYNTRETRKSAVRHAEITAIEAACDYLGSWRLDGCELYVTLEPCPMCAGAAVNARIARVIFGAADPRAGAFGSLINLNYYPLNHKPEIIGGVCGEQCGVILRKFFYDKR